jgi:hypothetical protein
VHVLCFYLLVQADILAVGAPHPPLLPSEYGTYSKPRPESGLDCLVCAIVAPQRSGGKATMAHTRESGPDPGLGFQVQDFALYILLGIGTRRTRRAATCRSRPTSSPSARPALFGLTERPN